MASTMGKLLAAATLLIAYAITRSFLRYRKSVQNGCRPAPSRVGVDRLFGLDLLYEDMKLRRVNRLLPGEYRRFGELKASTYATLSPGRSTIMTADTENIRLVFSTEAEKWGIAPLRGIPMGAFCGQGFLTADGHVWERSRGLLKPSFNAKNISDYSRFGTFTEAFMKQLPAEDGVTVDLQPLLMTMFIDASQDFLIGQPPGAMSGGTSDSGLDPQAYMTAFNKSLVSMGLRIITGPFRVLLPASMTTQQWDRVYQYIDYFVGRALEKSTEKSKSQGGRYSLLEGITALTDDRTEIRNQVLQGMLAAQDTTPTLISNILFLLSRHPHVWQDLRLQLLQLDPESITAEKLRGVQLLRNVIREALRLYPVFSRLNRVALVDTQLPTGGGPDGTAKVFVPRGTEIMAHFYSLHRNTAVFGPDIESFNPGRWDKIDPSPWEFMPFGGGPRACLGQQKVINEVSYFLWQLMSVYTRVEARDECGYDGVQRLITKNANGCKVALFK